MGFLFYVLIVYPVTAWLLKVGVCNSHTVPLEVNIDWPNTIARKMMHRHTRGIEACTSPSGFSE